MASTINGSARQTHVSPGIYTKETDLTYASKSLGITTLGVVGETMRGPAFEPIKIENWREFQRYFGGTNPEKFRGSQFPKYELPYIAQSYLKQSNQLQVVRVLGLSGVNAGPAWVITASKSTTGNTDQEGKKHVIAVLRSRGAHQSLTTSSEPDACGNPKFEYDGIEYFAKNITLEKSSELSYPEICKEDAEYKAEEVSFAIDAVNYGEFTIKVELTTEENGAFEKYAVSLNPEDRNYIYKVLGGDPEVGEAKIYVEELYDVSLKQLIEEGSVNRIDGEVVGYPTIFYKPSHAAVDGILEKDVNALTRSDVGKRFLCKDSNKTIYKYQTEEEVTDSKGVIAIVLPYVDNSGKRTYRYYSSKPGTQGEEEKLEKYTTDMLVDGAKSDVPVTEFVTSKKYTITECVKNIAENAYYYNDGNEVQKLAFDFNNYKEQYRFASTPWVVSEIKGSANNIELIKLFRFHTISDGAASNTEIKVSIQNIDPTYGTFDVFVRSFYDTDRSPIVLESYRGVNLIPGDKNYIALRIGSVDGEFANVSTYITVEMNTDDKVQTSLPAGFLGYPIRYYQGANVKNPTPTDVEEPEFRYNVTVDEDIRATKQYFGVSDIMGIDEDVLKYKGFEAYHENTPDGLTPCFHLDSRIIPFNSTRTGNVEQTVSVDGVTGYKWSTVAATNVTDLGIAPKFGDDEVMAGTIYEDKRYRKFTMAFYGGFDGWDYYRTSRSNSDKFTYNTYKGEIDRNSGEGITFSRIYDPENYGFDVEAKILNTDWYAYMSGVRQLANPKTIDINVLATPGIDYVYNNRLVGDIIEMIEEERADSVYVVTTPDKPFGAGDSPSEMFTPQDAVYNLEESEIDSNYTCTYYPWVKYFDEDNSVYVMLPPTRDVVRNFAFTDNTKYPWFAAAGWNRGNLENNAVKPRKVLKLAEQDILYNGRINFINNFANEGMKIWGDKNLQVRESQMNRISKRRLLLRIRKLCAIAAIGLIFDPNDATTKQSFESAVDPILSDIMSKRGITDYRIEIDDSQEARDRLELPAKIFIKPTPNLEYITIDFIITPSGVAFDDI